MSSLPMIGLTRRTRPSPFFEATRRYGAKAYTVYNHMLMPIWYETPEADYWHLINNVTVWDVAGERQVELTGPDAFTLVRLMTPRNLSKIKTGQCKYVPLVDENGGIINDPVLLKLDEDHFWLSLADSDVLLYAKGLAHGLGLDVNLCEPDVSPLAIQGPRSDEVAANLFGEEIRDLGFFKFRPIDLDDIPLIVARSGWSKQGGFELYLRDGCRGDELWERVMTAGADLDIRPAAPSLMERIEGGLLSYGNDMTLENNPFEIGLDKFCHLDQPFDFLGREALKEIKGRGITQRLMGLVIETSDDQERLPSMTSWWPLSTPAGKPGKVTSTAYSPRLEQQIALGYVPSDYAAPGRQVMVHTPVGERTATVCAMPFVK